MTWKDGFAEWSDSYRWRGRKEKERIERMTQIEHALVALQAQVNAQQSHQATDPSQRHEEPALEATSGTTPLCCRNREESATTSAACWNKGEEGLRRVPNVWPTAGALPERSAGRIVYTILRSGRVRLHHPRESALVKRFGIFEGELFHRLFATI